MAESWEEITGKRAALRIKNDPAAQARLLERWRCLSEAWGLAPVTVFEMGVHSSTQKVRTGNGQTAVLKLFITPGVFAQQCRTLELSGCGPAILAADHRREALLLELIPGTPGVNGRHFDIARARYELARWHAANGEGLPGLVEHHLEIAEGCLGFGLSDEALGMADFFRRLDRGGKRGLVHGDLVPENIVCSERSCCFLDPRGYCGDQTFDWATLALYSAGSDLPGMLARAERLSGVSIRRLAAWAWLRAVLSDAQERKVLGQDNGAETDTLRLARSAEPFFRRF